MELQPTYRTNTLSDGSETYDVVWAVEGGKIIIGARDEQAANELTDMLRNLSNDTRISFVAVERR